MFKNLWPGSLNDPEITGFLTAVWTGQGELLWNKAILHFWEREDPFAFLVRCRDGKVDIHIGRLCGHPSTELWFSREIELYVYTHTQRHTNTHAHTHKNTWASLVAQMVKNLPVMQEIWVQSQGWEGPLEKGMATHSSILAWRIQWTEEPGGLQSMRLQRVGHNWVTFTFALYIYTYVCIRCEKLAHVIMEADKSPDLQLAGWSSRKATGVVPRQRPTGLTSKKVTVSLEVQRQGKEMATHSSVFAWRIPWTGAWWAAVYGVAQSRTRLTWLSSSSKGRKKMHFPAWSQSGRRSPFLFGEYQSFLLLRPSRDLRSTH